MKKAYLAIGGLCILLLFILLLVRVSDDKHNMKEQNSNQNNSSADENVVKDNMPITEPPKVYPPIDYSYIEQIELDIPDFEGKHVVLFLADTHMQVIGEEESTEVAQYTEERRTAFVNTEGIAADEFFPNWINAANEACVDAVLFGGDIIDAPTEANLGFLREQLSRLEMPYLYTLGNHDWTYPWEYMTEVGKKEYIPQFREFSGDNPACSIIEFEDLVLVSIDNSTDQVNPDAMADFKSILTLGKPVIILMHVPLATLTLEEQSNKDWGRSILIGGSGIKPNGTTQEFLDLIYAEDSPVKAILAGHVHFSDTEKVQNSIMQVVSDDCFSGKGLLITIK